MTPNGDGVIDGKSPDVRESIRNPDASYVCIPNELVFYVEGGFVKTLENPSVI